MRVILGPMEGVLDHLMREMLTELNHYDLCVTEFVRVVDQLLPEHVFKRLCPELDQGSQTRSGTPVRLQLLGQDPHWMAENAVRAVELGSQGLDLNFGCPAKMVNKSKGGAALLQHPELIHDVVAACRQAIGTDITLSAKIRLGWENPEDSFEILSAIETAGADEITIHGRTKMGGYKASEIKWDYIGRLKQRASIPVIANGEIWNYQDGQRCLQQTNADALMVCRGAFNIPNLGNVVKYDHPAMPWPEVVKLMLQYSTYEIEGDKGLYYPNRIKQWLAYLRHEYSQADQLFREIRRHNKAEPIRQHIEQLVT